MRIPWSVLLVLPFLSSVNLCAQSAQAPLTVGEKAQIHAFRMISPFAFLGSAAGASIEQWRVDPQEWGVGPEGFARRYASNHGFIVIDNVIGFAADAPLHFDPRYHPSPRTGIGGRIQDAVEQSLVGYKDNGRRAFNWPNVASTFISGQISNAWYPHRISSFGDGLVRSGIGMAYSALANVGREFWPDVRRIIRH